MAIIPIPGDKTLSAFEVAEHWAEELWPPRDKFQVLDEIIRGWLEGKLHLRSPARLDFLKIIYAQNLSYLSFYSDDEDPPNSTSEVADGECLVCLTPDIKLPSRDVSVWNTQNCAEAFSGLAELRDYQQYLGETAYVGLMGLKIREPEFRNWLTSSKVGLPKFWERQKPSKSNRMTPDEIQEWWEAEGYTDVKTARAAFSALPNTGVSSAEFTDIWNAHWQRGRGRPRGARNKPKLLK